jgi:hypothetical protein
MRGSLASRGKAAAARLLCGAAIGVLSLASQAAPGSGVYRWESPANVDDFSQWLGRQVDIATAYQARATWDDIDGASWQLSPWSQWVKARSGRNLSLGIGLLPPSGASLASCAAGQYDVYWRNLANNLAYYGLHWAYLRLGWEMDGGWYAWGAPPGSGKEASFAGCFRRVVQVMRQAQPANQWKFVFNPTVDTWRTTTYLNAIWPGDAYVDVVGVDIYDQSWATNTYPYPSTCDAACRLTRQQTAWNGYSYWLNILRNFALSHGKPLAFPEWGVITRSDGHGGGDNPYFVQKMQEFIFNPANYVAFHAYFNITNTKVDSRLTYSTAYDNPTGSTRFPNSAARFKQLFGAASSLTFTAPAAGATISGSFSDSSGCEVTGTGIARVVFFMDTTQLNTEYSGPWQCKLDTRKFANGTHTLRATAYNSAGAATTVTRSVNVQNGGPSGVTFTAPAAGATISGSFSDSSGCEVTGTGIARVVFFMDTTQLNTEYSARWQCKLDTRKFANGTHTLRATAYNSAGASVTVTRSVTVKN